MLYFGPTSEDYAAKQTSTPTRKEPDSLEMQVDDLTNLFQHKSWICFLQATENHDSLRLEFREPLGLLIRSVRGLNPDPFLVLYAKCFTS